MVKRFYLIGISASALLCADTSKDAHELITSIQKTNPQAVYDILNKRSINFDDCGEFNYLDLACCKLTNCVEKIEHYKEKHKKWSDRIDSEYDTILVNEKITHYKALSDKWAAIKQQVQNIVQMLAIYLGLSQTNAESASDLAGDVIDIIEDIETIEENNKTLSATK